MNGADQQTNHGLLLEREDRTMNDINSSTADNNKMYFLVVDFNVDDRFFTSMLLQRFGHNVCTAGSTEEAFSFMQVASPSVIIAESIIGTQLASRLKKNTRFVDVAIIVLAKAPDLDLDMRLRKGEFVACLTKPVDEEKFRRAIQTALERSRRKNIRIETSLLARLAGIEEGIVSVLSESGMFFPTEDPRPLNSTVAAELEIGERTIKLEAVVLYSFESSTSPFKEAGMGMKFVKISPDDQAFIRSYILEQLK